MRRLINRLLIIFAPLGAFIFWITGPVQQHFARGEGLVSILLMLAGLAVFVLIEALLLRYWFLPVCARAMSEKLYAGSYFAQDDPLMLISRQISAENRHDLLPHLIRCVEDDPRRVSAWLELARVLHDHIHDSPQAVQCLLRGANAVRRKEDKAFLLWRAAVMCEKDPAQAFQADEIYRKISDDYPNTAYGKLARKHL